MNGQPFHSLLSPLKAAEMQNAIKPTALKQHHINKSRHEFSPFLVFLCEGTIWPYEKMTAESNGSAFGATRGCQSIKGWVLQKSSIVWNLSYVKCSQRSSGSLSSSWLCFFFPPLNRTITAMSPLIFSPGAVIVFKLPDSVRKYERRKSDGWMCVCLSSERSAVSILTS